MMPNRIHKFLLPALTLLSCLILTCSLQVLAQLSPDRGNGTLADPRKIRETDSFVIEPPNPNNVDPALTFVGVTLRRYQPDPSQPIDSTVDADYTDKVTINGENEWALTLYTEASDSAGILQMDNVELPGGNVVQAFNLPYSDSDVFRLLFSSKDNLDSDPTVTSHNLRANETIFKLVVDYLYRSPNNIDWRFSSEPYYYQLNTDVYSPLTSISINDVPTYFADNLLYNDASIIFQLKALDPIATASGNIVQPSGLDQYRYQWFPNTGNALDDICSYFWTTPRGQAVQWQTIDPSRLITPDTDGYYQIYETPFTDSDLNAPGSYSLCFQASDEVGNIGSSQGKYIFVEPTFVSIDCYDYQAKIGNTCSGAGCKIVNLAAISGYGQSSLETSEPAVGFNNGGNTIGCNLITNAQGGYSIQMRTSNLDGAMTHTASASAAYTNTIPTLTNPVTAPGSWAVTPTAANWGIRLHTASVGMPLNSNQGSQPFSIYNNIWGSDDTYVNGLWAGLNGNDQEIFTRTTNLNTTLDHLAPSANDFPIFQVGAETGANYNAVSGRYSVDVIVTAVAIDD